MFKINKLFLPAVLTIIFMLAVSPQRTQAETKQKVKAATKATNPKNSSSPATEKNEKSAKDAPVQKEKVTQENIIGATDNSAPMFIKSNTLNLDSKKRVFTYLGNVEATKEDIVITSDKMIGTYDENNRLQNIVCEDHVVITRADRLRASSDHAIYDLNSDTIVLTEGPELLHNGNALSADKVTIYVKDDRSEAEGDVRVKVVKTDTQQLGLPKDSKGSDSKGSGFPNLLN